MIKIDKSIIIKTLLILFITSSSVEAGWFSDNWNAIKESIFGIKTTLQDKLSEDIIADGYSESDLITILQQNVESVDAKEFVSALIFISTKIDDNQMYSFLISLVKKKNLITGEIYSEILYNSEMMNVVDKALKGNKGDTLIKTRTMFDEASLKFLELASSDTQTIKISTPKVSSLAVKIFGNLGTINDNDDGLEQSWERLFRLSMSEINSAMSVFSILSGLDGTDKKESFLEFMILGIDNKQQVHSSEGVNFIISVIEGLSEVDPNNKKAVTLIDNWMQIFSQFDKNGQIQDFLPIGKRVMITLASRALYCNSPKEEGMLKALTHSAFLSENLVDLGENRQLLCGELHEYVTTRGLTVISSRISDKEIVSTLNSGALNSFKINIDAFLYTDIDLDGVPDHLDLFPGFNDNAFEDTNSNSIPDIFEEGYDGIVKVVDFDKDDDGILDFMDAMVNGETQGEDNNSNGVIDSYDTEIYFDANGDLKDEDQDGIPDVIDNEAYDRFLTDKDNDGIVDALDSDIYDDFNVSTIIPQDTDGDGIPDSLDFNLYDNFEIEALIPLDTDDDGIPDSIDTDIYDDFNYTAFIGADTDKDGIPDIIDPDIDNDGIVNFRDADINGDGVIDNGDDSDADGINDANDFDVDGDGIIDFIFNVEKGIEEALDFDLDNDGIYNLIDADADGDGLLDEGVVDNDRNGINDSYELNLDFDIFSFLDSDNDGLVDRNDSDSDGDGIENEADADTDGISGVDDGKVDSDADGIVDEFDDDRDNDGIFDDADSDLNNDGLTDEGKEDNDNDGIIDSVDADLNNDGQTDNGIDSNYDGVNDLKDKRIKHVIYNYRENKLFDKDNRTKDNVRFDANDITYVKINMPGERSVVLDLPLTGYFTDDDNNILMTSNTFENGSIFMISMATDGFGRAFMGNTEGGFEMSGNLQGIKVGEQLTFSLIEINGKVAGKTRIKPNGKDIVFSNSLLQE